MSIAAAEVVKELYQSLEDRRGKNFIPQKAELLHREYIITWDEEHCHFGCDSRVWYNCADISEECTAPSSVAFFILKLETARSSEVMVNFYKLQTITTQKTAFFIVTAVRTPSLTF